MANGPISQREQLSGCRRIVIKVGTRLITDGATGLNTGFLDSLARQMSQLREQNHEFIIVTSGSIFLGRRILALDRHEDTLPLRQAAAATGQPALMRHWSEALRHRGLICAQILLTQDDVSDRRRYLNVRNTIEALLRRRVIPIINENDSVSTEGITFDENDKLAALVASTIQADLAIYLSDQQGLFTANPLVDPDAKLVSQVRPEEDYSACAEGAGGPESKGGMSAKLVAATTLADCGIPVVMAHGRTEHVVTRLIAGENLGTFFVPRPPLQARKLWIATAATPVGHLVVDDGARRALLRPDGASLLPIGITEIRGRFLAGDLVRILGPEGTEVARGLSNYASDEVERIRGAHTSQIADLLGHVAHHEVVHRDNMVLAEQLNGR
ncbi:MAG: glutamate 5-kinase [candidate division WS1 bacterium]|nr:glutamate 5-kinase [candidate division WS1 bacterium]